MQTIVNNILTGPLASAGLAILFLLAGPNAASATESPHQQIRQAVKNFAVNSLKVDDIKMGSLDQRLRLSRCNSALDVFLPKGAKRVGKSTLGVQCKDTPGWKIYMPVHLSQFDRVVVSQQALPRGTVISPVDIKLRRVDLSQLNYGYFKSAAEVIGMQLKRPVRGGEFLSPSNLKPRQMVKRGDIITIMAEVQGLTVRVKGHALADGYRGEAIRVKNQRSKRILQAEVVAPGIVRVRL